jgi:rare lipoprotein A
MTDLSQSRHCRYLKFAVLGVLGCWLAGAFLLGCAGQKLPPPSKPGQPRPYRVNGIWYQPLHNARDYVEYGKASWYGKDFHGKRTSSGEIYNMHDLTAAHKTLPMGTFVRVHNLDNGGSVDVRINDRGPFVKGRIIDLSYSAAKEINIVGPGTAQVKVIALGAPAPGQSTESGPSYLPIDYYSGNFTFQVGAFTQKANAERMLEKLRMQYSNAHITTIIIGGSIFYRVRAGYADNLEEAERFEQRLVREGYPETFIVAE